MLFLGVLSVFQLILFPGLLIIRLLPAKRSFLQQLAYIFMLSLLANYVVIFLLVALGLYYRSVVLGLFAVETSWLLWVYRTDLVRKDGDWGIKLRSSFSQLLKDLGDWMVKDPISASLYTFFGLAAGLGVIWVLAIWVNNFDTVFQTWDAWASWDRWAEKWAQNRFPGDTWEYPQLIPVSYSLSYKFIGTIAVKFFGKSIMPLFTLVVVLMLIDLGRQFRSYGYLLGSVLALYSISLFLGEYIPEGYVDIPVACFSLMAVYTLLKARELQNLKEIQDTLFLGSLATAAAAVTKQPGLYVMAFYPFLAYGWILREQKRLSARQALVMLGKHFLVVLAIVVPWYAFMEYRILFGGNTSNIDYVISDIYEGQTLVERFLTAVVSLGNYAYLYAFLLLSLPVLNKTFRHIVILLIFPYSVLWALFLSYEHRNLAIAFPLIGLCVGIGIEKWVKRIRLALTGRRNIEFPAYAALLAVLLILGLGTLRIDGEQITQKQLTEQRQIFEAELNDKLYRYFSRANGPEPVITSYPIGWLPELKGYWILERFQDYEAYRQSLTRYPNVELILVPMIGVDQRILVEIQQEIEEGVYLPIFQEANYMLVRIPPRD